MPVYTSNASRAITLLPATTLAGPGTGLSSVQLGLAGMSSLVLQATFVYGAGGTTAKVFVQTSLDKGATWVDIASFAFLLASAKKISAVKAGIALAAAYVPTDGTLADDTIKDGLLGDRVRAKYITTGTYTGVTTLAVMAVSKG